MLILLGAASVVFSVLALSLVDCGSPVVVFCVVSCCVPVSPVLPLSFFSPSFSFFSSSFLPSSLGGSTFGLGLLTIGSQVVANTYIYIHNIHVCQLNKSEVDFWIPLLQRIFVQLLQEGRRSLEGYQTFEVVRASTAVSSARLLQPSASLLQQCVPNLHSITINHLFKIFLVKIWSAI